MITKLIKSFKGHLSRIHFQMGLGLLTLLLVTVVIPILVHYPSTAVAIQQVQVPERSIDRGKELYQEGRYQEAIALWQQAINDLEARGLISSQAPVLNYLSAAYQNLGEWQLASTTIDRSIQLLANPPKSDRDKLSALAQALNTKGRLQLKTGQTEEALETWLKAESLYEEAGNQKGIFGSKINQAQALRILGQYRRTRYLLEEMLQQLQQQPDAELKAFGLRSLGVVLQLMGDFQQAIAVLEKSLEIDDPKITNNERAATLLNLGNVARDLQAIEEAIDYYQKTLEVATDPLVKIKAQLNQLSLLVENQFSEQAIALVPEIKAQIAKLPPSRASVYAQIYLAQSLSELARQEPGSLPSFNWRQIVADLATALNVSRSLSDRIAEAYTLNQLGQIYEERQLSQDAKSLAQQALQIAQSKNVSELIVLNAWQLGRILKQEGKRKEALAAYKEAFGAIQNLRNDLAAINQEIQLNFSENIEPIHRQFVDLLLQENATQDEIKMAREVIEALQLAELDNFFQDTCLDASPVQIDDIDASAAVIYPIFLADRLEVILSIPDRPLKHYATRLPRTEIDRTLQELYSSLNFEYSDKERLRYSQQVYNWLIAPAKADLESHGIKTLVFILDGFLRNIPMSALYDGQQYLIEQYAVALSSGLYILSPQALSKEKFNTLTAGLTEARQGFSALPSVAFEVKNIASEVSSASKTLLDRKFTRMSFKIEMKKNSFDIVHLATHGQFSSDPERTFLLTWDGQIKVKELDELLQVRERNSQKPLQLLVLSACQTADGDRRAALGIAGIALRSGARSTLATLWSVRDESTAELMIEFYRQLTGTTSTKAEALRQAQLTLLRNSAYKHPFFWSGFVLVGNWL